MTRFPFKEQLVQASVRIHSNKHLDRLIEAPDIDQIWRKVAVGSNYQLRPRQFMSDVLYQARHAEDSVENANGLKRDIHKLLEDRRKRVISIARAAKTELALYQQLEAFLREPKCVIELVPPKGVKLDTARRIFMHHLSHYLHGQCRGKWLDAVVVSLTEILFECSISIDDVRRASGRRARMERKTVRFRIGQIKDWRQISESGSSQNK
jgi:hypothetical protein